MANNLQGVMNEIADASKWKRTTKKNYDVYVCMPKTGTKVTNRLEGSAYVTDESKRFIISGTVGETWVIDANKLAKTYCFFDGKPITPDELKKRQQKSGVIDWMHLKTIPGGGAGINWAFHLPKTVKNFPVQTSWGDTLYANRDGVGHGIGDFLVCADAGGQPNLNDVWVVNGEIFPTTYDMRAFPGLMPKGAIANSETPVPKSILTASDSVAPESKEGASKGRSRVEYQIVGRYMDGSSLVGYHLQSIETGKSGRFTHEQVCYLIGRDQVSNCTAQLYNGTVLLRGKGMSLNDLPVKQVNGELKNVDGKVRRGDTAEDVMNKFTIVGTIKSGRNTVGYVIQNAGCGIKKIKRQQVIDLASQGKISNARVQNYNGKVLLRGVNCNLDELPSEEMADLAAQAKQKKAN